MTEDFFLGILNNIKIYTKLTESDLRVSVNVEDLPKEIKNNILEVAKERKKSLIDNWIQNNNIFFIEKEQYARLVNLNDSVLKNRSIDNKTYLNFLLQLMNEKQIIEVFKSFKIRGYSNLKKKEKIDNLIEQLSDEEIFEFIEENEMGMISLEFAKALQILNKKSKESLTSYRVVNEQEHEIECIFSNFYNYDTTSFIIINNETIENPERSCDCINGREGGFCLHFWVGFIISYKKGFFNLAEWRLTQLPSNFESIVRSLNL